MPLVEEIENRFASVPVERPAVVPEIAFSRFDVRSATHQPPLLAWRERVGHVIDVLASNEAIHQPFQAAIDRYAVGDLSLTECHSDRMQLERSVARISTDKVRSFAFHVFLEGGLESLGAQSPRNHNTLGNPSRAQASSGAAGVANIVALDMNQPVRMWRSACHLITVFAPVDLIETIVPDADAMHCRVLDNRTPLARLVIQHIASLAVSLPGMGAAEARIALRSCVELLVSAFGKEARLTGNARATARAAYSRASAFCGAFAGKPDPDAAVAAPYPVPHVSARGRSRHVYPQSPAA